MTESPLIADPAGLSRMKWEYERERTGFDDLLAFGTADMDYRSPEPVLRALRRVIDRGHLGYLNQVSRQEDITWAMDSLLEDRYQLERRMMIQGRAFRDGELLLEDIALNEIAVTRRDPLKVLRYSVYVNDEYLNSYSADGVLVSTPTGSTAYNLSAGGPVISPAARMMVLTPICSHSLNARSLVLAPEDRVRIRVENSGQGVKRIVDTCRELGIPDPVFREETDPSRVVNSMPIWDGIERAPLSDRERLVLDIISRGGTETTAEIASEIGLSQSTVSRAVRSLQDKGVLRREGGSRKGRWVVTGRP